MEYSVDSENFILQGVKVQLLKLIQNQKTLLSTKTKKTVVLKDSQTLQDDVAPSKNFYKVEDYNGDKMQARMLE